MVFELVDLEDLGEKALQDFQESISKSADSERAAASLSAKVEFAYG